MVTQMKGQAEATAEQEEQEQAGEGAHDRFRRLAQTRMKKVLHDIRLVGNLAAAHYKYTPIEVDAIVAAIEEARESLEARFRKPASDVRDEFELPPVEEVAEASGNDASASGAATKAA